MNIFESPEKIKYKRTEYIEREGLNIEDLIMKLQKAKDDGWELDYNDFTVYLTRYAEETDEEYSLRISQLERKKNQRKQLYEELRKEFETE